MVRFLRSLRWHAWGGLAVGLAAGWLSHSPSRQESPVIREPAARSSVAARRARTSGNTPTALFLKETAGIPASRCEELFRGICAQKESGDTIQLEAVFRRWMELEDPKSLLERLSGDKDCPKTIWSSAFFEAWAAIDYNAATAGVANDGDFSAIRTLVALRRGDPAFLNPALELWDDKITLTSAALAALGKNDPDLASQVANLPGGPNRHADLIEVVAGGWATQDPQAAFNWVKSLDLQPENRTQALARILSEWLKTDLPAATEAFNSSGLAEAVKKGGRSSEALAVLVAPQEARSQVLNAIHLDPFLDIAGLYDRISQSQVDWDKREILHPPINSDGWFCTDPAKAAEDATKLPAGKARDLLMSYICNQWADRNPQEAAAFAKQHDLPAPVMRNEIPSDLLNAAMAAPAETFAPLISSAQEGPPIQLTELAQKWSAKNPEAAAGWLMSQLESCDEDTRRTISQSAMFNNFLGYYWAKVDAVGAGEWLENLPEGPLKERAGLAMSESLGIYSPDMAFQIQSATLSGETRMHVLQSQIRNVAAKIGPPAARELIESTDLTADERSALARAIDEAQAPNRR